MFRSTAHLKIMRRFAASALSLTVGRQMYEITIKRLSGEEAQERRASARHTQRKKLLGKQRRDEGNAGYYRYACAA